MKRARNTSYSIHNVVKFKVIDNLSPFADILNDSDMEYGNMRYNEYNDKFDFIVYLGSFKPKINDCYIIADKYFIKGNYFLLRNEFFHKFAKWNVEISNFDVDGKTIMRIQTNPFGSMFITNLINSLINFKLNQKGYSFIHASGICREKGGKGYIFSSPAGGGKTTIALGFAEEKFKLLGDNFVIIHKGKILGFHSPLNIFTYNLTPFINSRLNKRSLLLKSIIHKVTKGYIKLFEKVNLKHLFSDLSLDECKIKGAFHLVRGKRFCIQNISKDEFIEHLLIGQKLEFRILSRYVSAYSCVFPNSKLSMFWKKVKMNFLENFENCVFYKLSIPSIYNTNDMLDVPQRLLKSGLLS